MTLTQLTNEASRLLAAERATTNETEAKRLQAERDHIEAEIQERYRALLKPTGGATVAG